MTDQTWCEEFANEVDSLLKDYRLGFLLYDPDVSLHDAKFKLEIMAKTLKARHYLTSGQIQMLDSISTKVHNLNPHAELGTVDDENAMVVFMNTPRKPEDVPVFVKEFQEEEKIIEQD